MAADQVWYLWIDEHRPGWANMSLDLALLDRAQRHGESWLRLYQWEPHCLSFGRHEPASRAYDRDRIRALGLDTVRRPTGGRAVWHARELTYAVAAPWRVFGSLRGAYLEIHRLLGQALEAVGLATSLAPRVRTAALDAGACFSHPVGGEVLADGRKVVGSAQLRGGNSLLQHGSILLDGNQGLVERLRRDAATPPLPDFAEQRLSLTPEEVAGRIAEYASLQWTGRWHRVTRPEPVLRAASRHYPQFQSSSWTWAR